ncbi:MAG: radical SAM protein [Acidobacteria bacterium]|nr:radical SAM protein [Acidobacteriota bacterium]
MRGSHGWAELRDGDKRALIDSVANGTAPRGPLHLELDLTDRCNVDCYFCNQMDVRTKEQIPYDRIVAILDETVGTGLRSVRLAGGGDPLFHREIEKVVDAIHDRGLVIDNITTNGLGLTPALAKKLVDGGTREVLFSLNTFDAPDYARMMQVKPAIFDKVVTNIAHLVSLCGKARQPFVVVQFLLDRGNYTRVVDMYRLASNLGADVVAINTITEIPHERIHPSILLTPEDREAMRAPLREAIIADRGKGLLQICFPRQELNELVRELETELGTSVSTGFTTADTFRDENGFCFFGYYSAVVRGNGDMYPCCMLLNPDYKPLGNAMQGRFEDQWQGTGFKTLRHEMREVLLAGGAAEHQPGRFATLTPECVNAHACGLKNMYFRSDRDFYRDLGTALDDVRRKEIRFFGSRQQLARALQKLKHRHPRLKRAYEAVAHRSPKVRAWLKRNLSVR